MNFELLDLKKKNSFPGTKQDESELYVSTIT